MFRLLIFSSIIFLFSCSERNISSNEPSSISDLSKALLEQPNDTALLIERRNRFIESGELEKAIIDQQQLFAIDTSNLNYRYNLADLYFELYPSNPIYISKSLALISDNYTIFPPMLLLRAKLYYVLQNYSQSLKDINTYLPSYPFDAEAYFFKGLNYKDMGDLEMAQSQFQTAVEQDPNYVESYEQLAFIYSFKGDSLAKYYFKNALIVDSNLLSSWYNLGMYYQNQGDFYNAKQSYYGMLRRDSLNKDANYNLGYISLVEGNYESAIQFFSFVISQNRAYASAFFSRGLAYKFAGNNDFARKDFEMALELSPEFKEAKDELQSLP
jgi:tetratricopeptide (TPR) repeat protein